MIPMIKFLKKIQNTLYTYSSGENVLFFFIVTQILYALMIIYSIPKVMQYSNGMQILDLLPTGYSAHYVQTLFQSLGEIGRETYLFQQIPLDMIYPGLFAISYSLLLTLILKNTFSKENKIQLLSMVPILAGLFDYAENIGIIIMLYTYPDFTILLANITAIFSILKSTFTVVMFMLLIIGIIMFFIKKIKNKKTNLK
ncbi:hypothetical protein COB57_05385 [Candidatus Peregrinibacteria bacterium]|nr:MAG: hypothetical protein COB57_05385 [Candidatus Peregrinibacteria bacterium]